jgi:protein-S-isoprenylcysteine O-methyltransferase Ste14
MRRKVALSLFLAVSASLTIAYILGSSMLLAIEVLILHLFFLIDVVIRPPVEGVDREPRWRAVWGKVLMLALVYLPLYDVRGAALRPWFAAMGLGILVCGAILALSGRISLGKMGTPSLTIIVEPRLYTRGIYQFIRHPIYTGFALVFLGHQVTFMCRPGLIIWLVFLVSFIHARIRVEEVMLVEQFRHSYVEYQKGTWKLLPYIY